MKAYHATTKENARKILIDGFDLNAKRLRDPGDFGRGFYSTAYLPRAHGIGGEIIRVRMIIDKPLHFESMEQAYDWLDSVKPVTGDTIIGSIEERERAALLVQGMVEMQGYDGIVIDDLPRGIKGYEIVSYRGMQVVSFTFTLKTIWNTIARIWR